MKKKTLFAGALALLALSLASCGGEMSAGDSSYSSEEGISSSEEAQKYKITWKNWDGSVLLTSSVKEGETPSYTGEKPIRESNAQYDYAFSGWAPGVVPAYGDKTYTASFDAVTRKYVITWKNYDGIVLEEAEWEYGSTPSYSGKEPTKDEDAGHNYSFSGWSPSVTTVTGNQVYVARFAQEVKRFTVTWKNYDGKILLVEKCCYGETPSYFGTTPVREPNAQYSYEFVGWDSEDKGPIRKERVYTAQFKESIRAYTITWKNYDGTLLKTESLEYGKVPAYEGTPEREPDKDATYAFAGWDHELEAVTGEATYTATYSKKESTNEFLVCFNANGGEGAPEKQTKTLGTSLALPSDEPTREGYSFYGWNNIYENKVYAPGDNYEGEMNVVFYAMWLPICQNCGGTGSTETSKTCPICEGDRFIFEDGPSIEQVAIRKVTLVSKEGYEYSKDGSNWQSSNVFDGLSPDTAYYFYQRRATSGRIPFGLTSKASTATTYLVSYPITYVLDGGENNPDNPSSYSFESENIVLKDPTREGYIFKGWSGGDGSGTIPSGSHGDLTFSATWEGKMNSLAIETEDSSKGLVDFSGTGRSGEAIEATASPVSGYVFKGWYSNDTIVSLSNPYQFAMPVHDYCLTAKFVAITGKLQEDRHKQSFDSEPLIDSESGIVTYGLYPQTRVSDEATIASLEALTTIDSNGWYYLDGAYYVMKSSQPCDDGYTFDDGTTIVEKAICWFKCEPISWSIRSSSDDGEYSLVSSSVLDVHRYNKRWERNGYQGYYACDYSKSEIRQWLNEAFHNLAFWLGDSYLRVDADTNDKVCLLGINDYKRMADEGYCGATDWAKASHVWFESGYAPYWTSSPANHFSWEGYVKALGANLGWENNCCSVDQTLIGVRPAITIKVSE